jgi:glycosyltransferase involved in cell wall biosynthesis
MASVKSKKRSGRVAGDGTGAGRRVTKRPLRGDRHGGTAPLRQVHWIGPLLNVSGYADEGREFVTALHGAGLEVCASHLGSTTPGLLEGLQQAAPQKARVLAAAISGRPRPGNITVVHTPGCLLGSDPDSLATVGRTMFETDRVPSGWIDHVNELAEVWVPSQFNVDTFLDAGVRVPVVQVPEGVDGWVYHPNHAKLDIPKVRGTVFLSVFEWSDRKAPDVLLGAWGDAFGPKEDVTLILRIYPRGQHEETNTLAVCDRLVDEQLEALGRRRSEVAPIVVLGEHLPASAMPRLYCSADVYVSPTRGEAWGRPFVEAQACGRPTIATNWSALPEILRRDANLFIENEGLVQVPETFPLPDYHGHRWASPSRGHLAELLRWCHSNREVLAEMGRRGRSDMLSRWRWDQAASAIQHRAGRIDVCRAPGRRAPRAAQQNDCGPLVSWVGDFARHHSLAKVNRELASRIAIAGRLRVGGVSAEPGSLVRAAGLPFDVVGPLGAKDRAGVEVRHSWPPCFDEAPWPVVVIQPWEFGIIPKDWVEQCEGIQEIWTPSSYSKTCFTRGGVAEERVRVVPNGVDLEVFHPEKTSGGRGQVRFLYVGGTITRKGFDVALRAYCGAFGPKDDVSLVVKPFLSNEQYKGQNLDAALREAASDPRNPQIVIVDEELDERGLADLYRSCDVLLAPFRGEAFCLPVLEAMACGVPAVVTGAGGVMDFVSSETSWLVPATEVRTVITEMVPAADAFSWFEPDFGALVELLREAARDAVARRQKGLAGISRAREFSWSQAAGVAEGRLLAVVGAEERAVP